MARSLPPVSAKVIADIEKFVSDFKRAENVTRRTVSTIDRELGDLSKKVRAKFSVGDVGKDILRGAGLFGGFQIANTVADQIVKHFSDQAKFAEATEDSLANQLRLSKEMIKLQQTETEQMDTLRRERDKAWKDLQSAKVDAVTDEQKVKVNQLAEAYGQLSLALAQMEVAREKQADDESTALINQLREAEAKAASAGGGAYSVGLSRDDLRAGLAKRQSELHYLSSNLVGLTDPESLKTRKQLTEELLAVNQRLAVIYAEEARLGRDVGEAFAANLEDAIFAGEKLSDVLRTLAQDLLRLFFRQSIGDPLVKGIGAAFTGFFGGGRADGGPVSGGTPYIVGERGPELFVPRSSGAIVPNHALGGGDGAVFNFNYSFASGVTRQEVAGMLPQLVEASKRAVADAVSRGGGYRRGFA